MTTGWPRKKAARLLSAVALVIGLAACSTSNGSPASPDAAEGDETGTGLPVVTEVPKLVASLDLRLPLDAYIPSINEVQRMGLARRELISQCMLRLGVDIAIPKPVTGVGPRTWTERRYGLTDADEAAVLGYGLGKRDPNAHRDPTRGPKLSPLALAVLTGEGAALPNGMEVPPGGCSGDAERALEGQGSGGDPVPDRYLAQQLSQESFGRSQRDPRVLAAFQRWSDCMRGEGHDYDEPLDPFSDRSLQRGATRKAIDTAVDDVTCKRRTNVVGIWYAVESAHQKLLIEENRAALATLAETNAATSAVVARVL